MAPEQSIDRNESGDEESLSLAQRIPVSEIFMTKILLSG